MQHTTPYQPDLILKLKANDEPTLKALYIANYPKIERYILENNGTREDAKDVYQEAFIAVWRSVQNDKASFTGIDKLQGYMYRVAQYKWTDQLRHDKKNRTASLPETEIGEPVNNEPDSDEADYIEKVKQHYATMDEPCKDVLYRFYYQKQSMSQIANKYSWTDATAKNNKYRCLQRLRQMVLKNNNR
ncbi:MAG: sigma-70 family RNA polymerase sigma factor [Chitinophagaceae bacterium]|nr:sigma-70 family RNA polymerase sigma factor [Chitinophagaceae bacterium]